MVTKLTIIAVTGTALLALAATRAGAQGGPKVGDLAPDFSLRGSSQDGLLATPITLSGLRGQVVVLAFFPKARTKG